jgi:dihydrofolate reductase
MSKIFCFVGMSLDGFIAGPNRGPTNPLGDRGPTIHGWIYRQSAFRANLGLGEGGETGEDNRLLEATITRSGASIMGKRMFEEGERNWPEEAPFHCPIFVLTKEVRTPWERKGGTTFYFVNDGIQSALEHARKAAGSKDIRIAGGADVIRQFFEAGLIDECNVSLAPLLLGEGLRLFDGLDPRKATLEIAGVTASPEVTHLRYTVKKPA